jgi:hypothetical protein
MVAKANGLIEYPNQDYGSRDSPQEEDEEPGFRDELNSYKGTAFSVEPTQVPVCLETSSQH